MRETDYHGIIKFSANESRGTTLIRALKTIVRCQMDCEEGLTDGIKKRQSTQWIP